MLMEANHMEEGAPRIQKISLVLKPKLALRGETKLVGGEARESSMASLISEHRYQPPVK